MRPESTARSKRFFIIIIYKQVGRSSIWRPIGIMCFRDALLSACSTGRPTWPVYRCFSDCANVYLCCASSGPWFCSAVRSTETDRSPAARCGVVQRRPPVSHHTVCSVITSHNLTTVKRDGWNASRVCLSHARSTQNRPSITVMK